MSVRRLFVAAALLAAPFAVNQPVSAQSLNDVLRRTASYVADFKRQLSGIVAEEDYVQQIVGTARIGSGVSAVPRRVLKSDLLLVKPRGVERYVEFRDVFEVDGAPVRDRQDRVQRILRDDSPTAGSQLEAIISESARYNIGRVQRNVNTPLMPLQFLDAANQDRFTFKHVPKPKPVFRDAQHEAANDMPVFRVTAEMWTVEYQERKQATIIRRPDGRNLPARGRFWIDPSNGHVLISEMIVDGGGVLATITVSYKSEPLMGFLVPVEMRELYIRGSERISGHAQYGKFRKID
jgi:hypothetical protein